MKYIGKIWLNKPIKMIEVAEMLGLEDAAAFKSEDVVGTLKLKDENILVLLHLSWGDVDSVEKVRIYAHHLDEDSEKKLWEMIESMDNIRK